MNGTGKDQYISADAVPKKTGFRNPWGYTYFMRRGDAIKIGHSASPIDRRRELQVAFPDTLEILATIPNTELDEGSAQTKFNHLKIHGEWYRAEPELMQFIETIKPIEKRLGLRHEQRHALKILVAAYEKAPAHLKEAFGFTLKMNFRNLNRASRQSETAACGREGI